MSIRKQAIGRRGAVLMALGFVQVMIGWATLAANPANLAALPILNSTTPAVVGTTQIVFGFLGALFAFTSTPRDIKGFQLLSLTPFVYGFSYLFSGILGHYPLGMVYAVRGGVLWFGYALVPLIVSGMIGVRELNSSHASEDGPHE